jgi:hypothetical protein
MDEQVLRAMARWPNVPDVHGWLRLDRRGRWLLVDRNRPGFDEARHGAGSPITNEQIVEFIGRNYQADADGCWYWQNGPQRVFVDLASAPWIARVLGEPPGPIVLVDQAGVEIDPATIRAVGIGPDDALLLATERGAVAVHDLDLGALRIDATDAGGEIGELVIGDRRWPIGRYADPSAELGFVARPRPAGGEADAKR